MHWLSLTPVLRRFIKSYVIDRPLCLLSRRAPTCSARCPLHRATVRRAASVLAETLVSPPTPPPRAAQGREIGSFPCLRGKAGMGGLLRKVYPTLNRSSPARLFFRRGANLVDRQIGAVEFFFRIEPQTHHGFNRAIHDQASRAGNRDAH